jgi:hypothetical protein
MRRRSHNARINENALASISTVEDCIPPANDPRIGMTRRMKFGSAVVLLTLLVPIGAAASSPGENGPIVYTDVDGLHTVAEDGTGGQLISPEVATLPDVTADGAWALAVTDAGALIVIDMETGADTTLVASGVTGAAFSADGSRIAYSTDTVRLADFVADASPTLENDVVVYARGSQVFDWSPVDNRVLVAWSVPRAGFTDYFFEAVDVDTGIVTPIADNGPGLFTWFVIEADFSPDGTQIAYVSAFPGGSEAAVINDDGSGHHLIAEGEGAWHGGPDGPIAWSPDGSTVGLVTMPSPPPDEPVISLRNPASGAVTGEIAVAPTGFDWAPVVGKQFDDVADDNVFAADIEWLASTGITRGCNPPANTNFCPDDPVTRGQMAAFLVRALLYTDDGGGDLFDDDDDSVFVGDIDRLATAGVTRGCNPPANTNFCPDDPVTRGQMAAFLVRALDYTDDGGGDLFDDDDDSVFVADIDRLATAGVTRGCNPPANTNFCPDDPVTRGQMAAFLHRALGD